MATITTSNFNKYYSSGNKLFLSAFVRYPLLMFGGIIFSLITAALTLIPAIVIGEALDVLETQGYGTVYIRAAFLIFAIAFVTYIFQFINSYMFGIGSFLFERDLRQEFFDEIQNKSMTFHNENNSSKLLSLAMQEIQWIRHFYMPFLRMILQTFFSIGITAYYTYTLVGADLATIIVIGFLVYFILAYQYARRIAPIRNELSDKVGELTEKSQEIFRGIEVVRGLASEDREAASFQKTSNEHQVLARNEGRLTAFYLPGLVLLLITAISFWYLIGQVEVGAITFGGLIQIIGMLLLIQAFNFMIPPALLNLQAGLTNSERIVEKIQWEDPFESYNATTIPETKVWKEAIEFENVNFSYLKNGRKVLNNVSFAIPPESKVALIGGPGSGKTTILNMLLDLYKPQEGSIKIGGIDYTTIPDDEIRNHVASVEQDVFLFSGTIRDNIGFTKKDATDDEIMEAAESAQALEFISKLPDGIDTVIGERGVTLSGGQRQRIAIARAILANPEVLLLDDSSSALDAKTELLIRKALDNLSKNRLTITVTQRLNSLVRADLILVMEKGELIAIGKHDELIQTSDEYKKIFELLPESERLTNGGN
ncbi:MAG: ABC transporter ATP-binding protein [Candidatus Kariarchaeaceae archaeon]|jgi:ATP-binding cassette subfamily B protein